MDACARTLWCVGCSEELRPRAREGSRGKPESPALVGRTTACDSHALATLSVARSTRPTLSTVKRKCGWHQAPLSQRSPSRLCTFLAITGTPSTALRRAAPDSQVARSSKGALTLEPASCVSRRPQFPKVTNTLQHAASAPTGPLRARRSIARVHLQDDFQSLDAKISHLGESDVVSVNTGTGVDCVAGVCRLLSDPTGKGNGALPLQVRPWLRRSCGWWSPVLSAANRDNRVHAMFTVIFVIGTLFAHVCTCSVFVGTGPQSLRSRAAFALAQGHRMI